MSGFARQNGDVDFPGIETSKQSASVRFYSVEIECLIQKFLNSSNILRFGA